MSHNPKKKRRSKLTMSLFLPVDMPDFTPESFLEWASDTNNITMVKDLIKNGVDCKTNNNSPIRHASRKGNTEIVKLLLESGAEFQEECIHEMCVQGHAETFKLLLEKKIQFDKSSTLTYSIMSGKLEIARLLIEDGADFTAQKNKAIRVAASKGYNNIVKLLLGKGADCTAKNNESIISSAYNGHAKTVKLLIEHKADFTINQNLPLKYAIHGGRASVINILIEQGSRFGIKDIVMASKHLNRRKCILWALFAHGAFEMIEREAKRHNTQTLAFRSPQYTSFTPQEFMCIKRQHQKWKEFVTVIDTALLPRGFPKSISHIISSFQ